MVRHFSIAQLRYSFIKIVIPTLLCGADLIFHAIISLSCSNCIHRLELSFVRGDKMSERKKSIIRLFVAAGLLFAVSGYRQLSMRYWPEDFLRPYLVWAVYMLLLLRWQYTSYALAFNCAEYREYPVFNRSLHPGCFPLC